jgi:asparagine N-glycosylation enzyme membrane subunit Stt3
MWIGAFIFIPLDTIITKRFPLFEFSIIPFYIGILLFFWIYSIGFVLDKLDIKTKNNRKFKQYVIYVILTQFVVLLGFILGKFYLTREMPIIISWPIGIIQLYGMINITIFLTKRFSLYYSKRKARIIDYFVYLCLIGFFPLGMIILNSQIRTIINENDIK